MTRAKAVGHKLIVCCKANPDIHIINVKRTAPDVWRRPIAKIWLFWRLPGLSRFLSGRGRLIFETTPPRDVVMATGAVGGANYELGIRYREILSQSGVKLQLLPTTGGLENLARLRKAGVDIGFIQGGTTRWMTQRMWESLGTIFYEPLWFFYRGEIGQGIQALRGRRVSIGPEGSGTRALALTLIQRFKLDSVIGVLSGFEPQE